ncbi:Peptidase family M48 [Xenococcus sp. PCC 7305]|uniref:M48 family metallopeptidase n=1 Tax=Xenococcus sp. PCC 7305 TaxID=102125 RepID=UPI0002AB9FBC|nr:M48 family metallopeptidase [Xenococcus sp. PCC 7305]ELS05353.1 Peptidase family M48 [Xenococcus sp. PCC 7305]
MRLPKQLRLLARNQLFLVFLTFSLVILSSNAVISKSLISAEQARPVTLDSEESYQVSQNFLNINFGGNYYPRLAEADRFYKQGDLTKAREIQETVKPDFEPAPPPASPQVDAENLSPAGKVYWRIANQGMEEGLESKIFVPLEKLTENSPDFIPGHLLLLQAYEQYEKDEEALAAIERLATLYPEQTDVLDKRIELLVKNDKYLEASIAARQFAIAYPDDPQASRYQAIASEYKRKYRNKLQQDQIISGILSTAVTVVFVGDQAGFQTGAFLLAGESEAGKSLAQAYQQNLTLVNNSQLVGYVDSVSQNLARLMGRDEFEYEFFIVEDPSPNAFALPGGKIFINTGMLQLISSEAELAGLLGHEIAHSVLSHGFQDIASNSLTSLIPFGEFVNADLSRDQEKQADILGTRVLASSGYSADGLYNIMAKLKQLEPKSNWSNSLLASHPASETRMNYLEELIQRNGYNRYAYEGVERYQGIFAN